MLQITNISGPYIVGRKGCHRIVNVSDFFLTTTFNKPLSIQFSSNHSSLKFDFKSWE